MAEDRCAIPSIANNCRDCGGNKLNKAVAKQLEMSKKRTHFRI